MVQIKELLIGSKEPINEFVMVGDRKEDMIAAIQNKIDSIYAGYGYGRPDELANISPTHIAKNIDELKTILL